MLTAVILDFSQRERFDNFTSKDNNCCMLYLQSALCFPSSYCSSRKEGKASHCVPFVSEQRATICIHHKNAYYKCTQTALHLYYLAHASSTFQSQKTPSSRDIQATLEPCIKLFNPRNPNMCERVTELYACGHQKRAYWDKSGCQERRNRGTGRPSCTHNENGRTCYLQIKCDECKEKAKPGLGGLLKERIRSMIS